MHAYDRRRSRAASFRRPARRAEIRPRRIARAALLTAALPAAALLGCSSKVDVDARDDRRLSPAQCASTKAEALSEIAERVYREVTGGRIARPAVERVARSPALLAAALERNPLTAAAAVRASIRHQLVRVRVTVGGRTLVEYGHAQAIAPVSVPLTDGSGRTIGTVTGAEQSAQGYADTVQGITATPVLVRSGSGQLASTTHLMRVAPPREGQLEYRHRLYTVHSFTATRFPSGTERMFVLAPSTSASSCGPDTTAARADALGAAAERLYEEERSGSKSKEIVREVERSPLFRKAVLADDKTATEAAIVALFKTSLHVVRVRATLGGRLVADVGGPAVLAPVEGRVRDARGRTVGRFQLSVQDDLGYEILTHRFIGAQVLLRQGEHQLVGNLAPGPAKVPDRGKVRYGGVTYYAYSFFAQAFPAGALRVSLLIPTNAPA